MKIHSTLSKKEWLIRDPHGELQGPYSMKALQTLKEDGYIKADTLIAHQDDTDTWLPYASFGSLQAAAPNPKTWQLKGNAASANTPPASSDPAYPLEVAPPETPAPPAEQSIDIREVLKQSHASKTHAEANKSKQAQQDKQANDVQQLLANINRAGVERDKAYREHGAKKAERVNKLWSRARLLALSVSISWVLTLFDPWLVFFIGIPIAYGALKLFAWIYEKAADAS